MSLLFSCLLSSRLGEGTVILFIACIVSVIYERSSGGINLFCVGLTTDLPQIHVNDERQEIVG
jgi:hypothetical protein